MQTYSSLAVEHSLKRENKSMEDCFSAQRNFWLPCSSLCSKDLNDGSQVLLLLLLVKSQFSIRKEPSGSVICPTSSNIERREIDRDGMRTYRMERRNQFAMRKKQRMRKWELKSSLHDGKLMQYFPPCAHQEEKTR